MQITVRFASLVGPFSILRTETFSTEAMALDAVKAHAATAGYTCVKVVDTDDGGLSGLRYTARTPGGRSGRNVAFSDDLDSDDCY